MINHELLRRAGEWFNSPRANDEEPTTLIRDLVNEVHDLNRALSREICEVSNAEARGRERLRPWQAKFFAATGRAEAAEARLRELERAEAVAWRKYPDEVPPPGTECLIECRIDNSTHRAVDVWEQQHETPVEWSSATVATGMGWSAYGDAVLRWIPLDKIIAAPAPAVPEGWLYRGGGPHPVSDSDQWRYQHGPDRPVLTWEHQEIKPVYAAPPALAVPDDVAKDAARLRWLLEDHADPETRVVVKALLVSMRTRSLSGARLDIDAAMLAATPEVKS